LKAVNEV
jgi:hypothetical protein